MTGKHQHFALGQAHHTTPCSQCPRQSGLEHRIGFLCQYHTGKELGEFGIAPQHIG